MKRVCPNCKVHAVSVLRLMFGRPRCRRCGENIGHHWLFNAIFVCFDIFVLLFLALYLISSNVSLWASLVLYLLATITVTFLWALFGPIESKQGKWEP